MDVVEVDAESRATIPGHAGEQFWMIENPDGTMTFEPVRIDPELQRAYDTDPRFREMLDQATASPSARVFRPDRPHSRR